MEGYEVKQFLLHLAECASKINLPAFRTSLEVTDKAEGSLFDPVTDIDLRTEKAIINEIKVPIIMNLNNISIFTIFKFIF